MATLQQAKLLIEVGDTSWYDFCANLGHIPDNVAHLKRIQLDFVNWLDSEDPQYEGV